MNGEDEGGEGEDCEDEDDEYEDGEHKDSEHEDSEDEDREAVRVSSRRARVTGEEANFEFSTRWSSLL